MSKILKAGGFLKINFALKLIIVSSCVLCITSFLPTPIFPENESESLNDVNRQTQLYSECCKRWNIICQDLPGEDECPNESGYNCIIMIKECVCNLRCVTGCPESEPLDFCRPNCNDAPFIYTIEGCNRMETAVKWEEWFVVGGDPSFCNPMECFCEWDNCVTNPAKKALILDSCEGPEPPGTW